MKPERYYETDKVQCQAMTQHKVRCTRIGTHGNGGKILCERHHQIAIREKVNAEQLPRRKK